MLHLNWWDPSFREGVAQLLQPQHERRLALRTVLLQPCRELVYQLPGLRRAGVELQRARAVLARVEEQEPARARRPLEGMGIGIRTFGRPNSSKFEISMFWRSKSFRPDTVMKDDCMWPEGL